MGLDTEKLEAVGRYRGTIEGHNLFVSDKGKRCPQATLQLKAADKYITSPEELQHFSMTEPGWRAWDFNQGITAFCTLYNSGEEFSPETENLNAGQFAKAVGWTKGDFEAFTNGSFVGKQIQFQVEAKEYNGKTNNQVTWIDAPDASPERQLKEIGDDALRALKAKVKGYAAKRPAAASAPRPTAGAARNTVSAPSVAPASSSAVPVTKAPPVSRKAKAKAVEAAVAGLPPLCTRDEAWESVYAAKGKLSDDEATDAFIINTEQVGGDKLEENFTPAEWGMVRDRAIESLEAANVVA